MDDELELKGEERNLEVDRSLAWCSLVPLALEKSRSAPPDCSRAMRKLQSPPVCLPEVASITV